LTKGTAMGSQKQKLTGKEMDYEINLFYQKNQHSKIINDRVKLIFNYIFKISLLGLLAYLATLAPENIPEIIKIVDHLNWLIFAILGIMLIFAIIIIFILLRQKRNLNHKIGEMKKFYERANPNIQASGLNEFGINPELDRV
jgi:hypothetical protein